MRKLTLLPKIKLLLVFALAVCLGLWSGGFFDRYIFSFGIYESFSTSEARDLIGKRVKNACQAKPNSDITGEIIGYTENDFGDIHTKVRWEENDAEKSGVLSPTGFSKGYLQKCLKVVESD